MPQNPQLGRIEQVLLRGVVSFLAFELAGIALELTSLGGVSNLNLGIIWVGVAGSVLMIFEKWLTTAAPAFLVDLQQAINQPTPPTPTPQPIPLEPGPPVPPAPPAPRPNPPAQPSVSISTGVPPS